MEILEYFEACMICKAQKCARVVVEQDPYVLDKSGNSYLVRASLFQEPIPYLKGITFSNNQIARALFLAN